MKSTSNKEAQYEKYYEAIINNLPLLVKGCFIDDLQTNFECCQRIRKLVCKNRNPPIDIVIQTGIVPRLIQFINENKNEKLQFEALWIITNIASGKQEHTLVVIKHGSIPAIIKCLENTNDSNVLDQSIWSLGNIIGDSVESRNMALECNGLNVLLKKLKIGIGNMKHFKVFKILLKYDLKSIYGITNDLINLIYKYYFDYTVKTNNIKILRNFTWTVSNFCRGKPGPKIDYVKMVIPVLVDLLYSNDEEILVDACWAFSYLSDSEFDLEPTEYDKNKEKLLVNSGGLPKIVELLSHNSQTIQHPALRALGNLITSNDDKISKKVITLGLIPSVNALIDSDKPSIRKEACWTISNTIPSDSSTIKQMIKLNVFKKLVSILMSNDKFAIKKECCWALANATKKGSINEIRHLINIGTIPALCVALEYNNQATVFRCLEGLSNLLKFGEKEKEKNNGINKVSLFIEESGALDKIENLQLRNDVLNDRIINQIHKIINTYFS